MKQFEEKLQEYLSLLGESDPESVHRKDELLEWLNANATEADRASVNSMVNKGLDRINRELLSLRFQMGDVYGLLPISYIAEHYFGKSPAWLYQRINGTPVRGKTYTLNEEQKQTFNRAVKEIGQRLCSFQMV